MSIRLTTGSRIAETSSKGNQEKWLADGRWYKLDLFGYEGLAEAVTSALLAQTNTGALGFRYVTYRMERMEVHGHIRNGCSSANFLRQGEAKLFSPTKRLPNRPLRSCCEKALARTGRPR